MATHKYRWNEIGQGLDLKSQAISKEKTKLNKNLAEFRLNYLKLNAKRSA